MKKEQEAAVTRSVEMESRGFAIQGLELRSDCTFTHVGLGGNVFSKEISLDNRTIKSITRMPDKDFLVVTHTHKYIIPSTSVKVAHLAK